MSILSVQSYKTLLEEIPKWPGNYLEIGVYDGDMLRDFALRWPERMFYGIDPFISDCDTTGHHGVPIGERMEGQRASALANFSEVPNIEFHEETSLSFMDRITPEDCYEMNVGIVYVDGSHTYDDTLNDLRLAELLIANRGLIFIDDFDLPEVLRATAHYVNGNTRVHKHSGHMIVLR